jgi:TolB protein
MSRLSRWVSFVVFGCLAVLVLSASGGSSTGKGRIAFVRQLCYSQSHCLTGVAVVNADGSGLRILTPRRVHVASPRWSPDRSEIAYIRTSSKTPQVWLMAADGTHQRALPRLAPGVWSVGLPSLDWAPNGRQIVFAAEPSGDGGASQLYLANVRTGASKLLLPESLGKYSGANDPVWSPNGRWIAFVRQGRYVPDQIFLFSTATGRVHQLTHGTTYVSWNPTWSPNSRRIAFAYHGSIWVVNPDGSHMRQLVSGNDPSWSPDGKWIVFNGFSTSVAGLWEIRSDGSGRHMIKQFLPSSQGIQPDW